MCDAMRAKMMEKASGRKSKSKLNHGVLRRQIACARSSDYDERTKTATTTTGNTGFRFGHPNLNIQIKNEEVSD